MGCISDETLNRKTRKLLTMHEGFHPRSNVARLYGRYVEEIEEEDYRE
jgi:hypothetical protein